MMNEKNETYDDIVDAVLADHRTFRTLFDQFDAAGADERTDVWQMLVRGLAVHETAEEEIVHPRVRRLVDGGDDVAEARKTEEDQAKKTLAELEKLGPDAPAFDDLFAGFKADVLTHADAEEREELAPLRDVADDDERRAMAKLFNAAKAVAPTHAHKLAPESAVGNVVVGPVVALMDRVRDAIRDARAS